jgi:putative intracellular protease/amidase
MRSDAYRNAKYDAKTAAPTIGLKVAAQLADAKAKFAAQTNLLVAKQQLTAAVLDAVGIVGLMRGRYQAYSNRLFAITQRFSGLTATNMAQLEHDRWESVCQSAVMITIAHDVYDLTVA